MLPSITQAAKQTQTAKRPIKVVQFGEGNFLRAFVDYFIDIANEKGVYNGDVAIVKPIAYGNFDRFHAQENLYTVNLRGVRDGRTVTDNRLITCIQSLSDPYTDFQGFLELAKLPSLETVVSNTTEAGIVLDPSDRFDAQPPATYPGKLTRFLFERYKTFQGDQTKGLIVLPVELIEANGHKLLECVMGLVKLWKLEDGFRDWVKNACVFASTLVDRIVTGYPREEAVEICGSLGYEDQLLDTAEPFGLWVIESEKDISSRFPLDKAGLPILFTTDQKPYRERKVRILNGAHTTTVLAAFLAGKDYVKECMDDKGVRRFMEKAVLDEIVPCVPLPREEAEEFAQAVFERFENPFVKHALLSISLNSVSKWKSRVLPSLRDSYKANGTLPPCLTFSFAALLAFYSGSTLENGALKGNRNGEPYQIRDDEPVLRFFADASGKDETEFVRLAAAREDFWGEDLGKIPGFHDTVTRMLQDIRANGAQAAMEAVLH